MSEPPIRIVIADDHALLRTGLRRIIDAQPDMEVVDEACDAATTIERVTALKPDVLLLDLAMPGGGLIALRTLRDARLPVRVLIVTMFNDRAHLRLALEAGASGYVIKSAPHTELIAAIRAVHQGHTYVNQCVDEGSGPVVAPAGGPRSRPLSPREREILTLVARGHTSREIAGLVGLSVKTVEAYRARLMHKLELENRAELVNYAIHSGLVEWPSGGSGT